jgi:predicted phage-related endonuclease
VQAQIACTGARWGSLVALFGGIQVAWKDLLRNDRFIALAMPKLEEFWWRVQRREPPEVVDGRSATTDALKALYAADDGTSIDLDGEALQIVESWEAACGREKFFKAEAERLENQLRRLIGSHTLANLPDGTWLKAPVTNVKGRVQKAVEPYSYRRITRGRPRLPRRTR